jgi:hypothetical protein
MVRELGVRRQGGSECPRDGYPFVCRGNKGGGGRRRRYYGTAARSKRKN